jgi:DedD protein
MQKVPSNDQELNLKKRARRRLVGAIALVLLMVIVLPMILQDRSATQPQDQITITLPSEQMQAEASDFDSNIVPTEPSITILPEVAEPESGATTPDLEASASKRTPEVTLPTTKPEEPTSTPTPAVKSSTEANSQYHVQIGIFSDAANVKQLQAKLSDLGYKSQIEKIDTDKGKKIRLRTQAFGDRNEAAIALEIIKDAGLTGMVVSQ